MVILHLIPNSNVLWQVLCEINIVVDYVILCRVTLCPIACCKCRIVAWVSYQFCSVRSPVSIKSRNVCSDVWFWVQACSPPRRASTYQLIQIACYGSQASLSVRFSEIQRTLYGKCHIYVVQIPLVPCVSIKSAFIVNTNHILKCFNVLSNVACHVNIEVNSSWWSDNFQTISSISTACSCRFQ